MWVTVEQTIALLQGKMIQTGVTPSSMSRSKLTIHNSRLIIGKQKDGRDSNQRCCHTLKSGFIHSDRS